MPRETASALSTPHAKDRLPAGQRSRITREPDQDGLELDNYENARRGVQLLTMPGPPIERAEVVALLLNVSDRAVTLTTIERLLAEDDGEEETDED